MDVMQLEDKFNNLACSLGPILDFPTVPKNSSMSTFTSSFNTTNLSETANSNLWTLRERILCSQQKYLISKMELEKYNKILNYLNQTKVEDVLHLNENDDCFYSRENKEEESKTMWAILNKTATKFSDEKIADTKLKYLQRELDLVHSKFNKISEILNVTIKLLTLYISLSIMYQQEKKDISSSNDFFRTICKEPVMSLTRIVSISNVLLNKLS